jgi:hypothetical protein
LSSTNAGQKLISFDHSGVTGWCIGQDSSGGQSFKIANTWSDLANTTRFTINSSGNTTFSGTVTASGSDRRLKTGLELVHDHWNIIDGLHPYRFRWNEKGCKIFNKSQDYVEIGLIAQDVQAVLPQAVCVNECLGSVDMGDINMSDDLALDGGKPEYLTIQYDKLIPVLIKAIQDLKSNQDVLIQENNIQKISIQELLASVSALTQS